MTYIQALLMGIIQGLAEFLPISSSAHIVLTSYLYKVFTGSEITMGGNEEIFFDIVIHFGTLIAVLIYFRKDIAKIIYDFFKGLKEKDYSSNRVKLPLYILLGTFITCCVVFPLKKLTENLLSAPDVIGLLLLVTAIILFASEIIAKKFAHKTKEPTLLTAIITGLAQGLAIFPGISRSGATISAGMLTGLDRVSCARYSFLLSIPIIIGATFVYPFFELSGNEFVSLNWGAMLVGFLSSAIVGFLCVKYFMKFISKYSMKVFAYYCAVVGVAMFVFFRFVV